VIETKRKYGLNGGVTGVPQKRINRGSTSPDSQDAQTVAQAFVPVFRNAENPSSQRYNEK
jgi:hypothetical protein